MNGDLDRTKSGQFHAAVTISPKKKAPFLPDAMDGRKVSPPTGNLTLSFVFQPVSWSLDWLRYPGHLAGCVILVT